MQARRASELGASIRAALLLVAFALSARSTNAAEDEAVELDYAVDASCPTRAEFEALVRQEAPGARFVEDGARLFETRVVPRGSGFRGTLSVRERDGTRSERTFDGATCAEVIEALGLSLGLALAPESKGPQSNAPVAKPDPPSDLEGLEEGEGETPAPSLEKPVEGPRYVVGLRGRLGFARGADRAAGFVAPGFEVDVPLAGFRASARVEVAVGRNETPHVVLEWIPGVRAEICPVLVGLHEDLSVGLCPGFEVGRVVSSAGTAATRPLPTATRPLALVDLAARALLRFEPLRFEVLVGAELPLATIDYRSAGTDGGDDELLLAIEPSPRPFAALGVGWEFD